MKRILVVDDEKNMCTLLKMFLEKDGYAVVTANDGAEAIGRLRNGDVFDLVISDLRMPKVDGMELLRFLNDSASGTPLVVITAYGSIEGAVDFMKKGAADFIPKPFNKDVVRQVVRRILHIENLEAENRLLRGGPNARELVFASPQMMEVVNLARKVANVMTPVLITGESGTGKGLLARSIHDSFQPAGDHPAHRPFVQINCPGIPETLFESELFGYQRGAFTGASRDYKGKLRMADGGTLFLDEISDVHAQMQPKLLRLLEDRSFEPLGSISTVHIDARFICATNRDLGRLVAEKCFREDLFYRINAVTIHIPPLRERREDIEPIVNSLLVRIARDVSRRVPVISSEALEALTDYDWPGNVRELRNVLERAVVLSSGERISMADLPKELQPRRPAPVAEANRLSVSERRLVMEALRSTNWNVSASARELGISRGTLRNRMQKYRLQRE